MSRRLGVGDRGEVNYSTAGGVVTALQYYRDNSGRRRRGRGSGRTKAAALRAVTEVVDAALSGSGQFRPTTTLATAAEHWLLEVEERVRRGTRSPTTLDVYRRAYRVHVEPGVGSLRVAELTAGRLDRFLSEVHVNHGHAIAKMCRTVLSGVCGLLVRRDALRHNPVRDVGPLERGRLTPTRALTPADARAWLAHLDASAYARRKDLPDLVRLLMGTGMRLGEALAVAWEDVDLERGVVAVEWTVVRVVARGLVRKTTKSANSDRTLVLPTWCVDMLRRRLGASTGTGPVFPSEVGGWRDRNNVSRDIRTVRAGSPVEWFVSHTARRTVATVLDGQGLSARSIADQLGHARVSMTQDVYMGRRIIGHEAARSLDGLVSPGGADDAP